MGVVVYTSSASANAAVKNKQKAIVDFLKSRKIEFEEIDLCVHTDAKDVMRSKIPEDIKKKNEQEKKNVIPPQVFNDDEYCGDYDMFFAAREMEVLHTFFKVPPTPQEAQKMKSINWAEVENKENDANAGNALQQTTNQADVAGEDETKPKDNVEEDDAEKCQSTADDPTENPEEKLADTHESGAIGSQENGDTEGDIQDELNVARDGIVTEGKEDQLTKEDGGTGEENTESQDNEAAKEDLKADDQTSEGN